MNKSIRWLLTEAKLSGLDTNKINIVGDKLICYHLTSKQNWIRHNEFAKRMDTPPSRPDREILPTDTRAKSIVKRISNVSKNKSYKDWQIEELVVEDLISDPYTETSGFVAGGGDYHGKGLYTCYKFNPSIASHYGNICLVFEVDISNFLITFEDLAKQVHGEDWSIRDQLLKFYKREEKSEESIQKFKQVLNDIPDYDEKTKMAKTINSFNERTAGISQHLLQIFGKNIITSVYDGVILYGRSDGPVCTSFFPKYDAKLIGLGRLNPSRPEVVDWYDSLNDFVRGRAKLKQDFETINAIAAENSDPQELEAMKLSERIPFDVQYLQISTFFKSHSNLSDVGEEKRVRFFDYYEDIKSKNDKNMLEFFLMSFKSSQYVWAESVVKSGPLYNEIVDQTINVLIQKNVLQTQTYFSRTLFENYLKYNIKPSDFFLKTCIKYVMNEKAFQRSAIDTRDFYKFISQYIENNEVSEAIKKDFNEKVYDLRPQLVVSTLSLEEISNYYKDADEYQKSRVIVLIVDSFVNSTIYTLNWDSTLKNYKVTNELLEKTIDEIKKQPTASSLRQNYDLSLLSNLFYFLPKINYFSSKASEYLASAFLENIDEIKSMTNKSVFDNIANYLVKELDRSHPVMDKIQEILAENEKAAKNDIDNFMYKLRLGVITKRQLGTELLKQIENQDYIGYLSRQSSEWFSNFVKMVIGNIAVIKQVLGQKQADYIIALIKSHDIVLTKEEQLKFTRKISRSHHNTKNSMASYKHIDPDAFIELFEPDMIKGGMGAGLSFKGFEFNPGVYRLLYKHRSIVNLFARAARPGLLKMIILNLANTIAGNPTPEYTWGGSGKLKSTTYNFFSHNSLPFININEEETTIPQIINLNDIAWFEYFLKMVKSSKGSGLRGAISTLEMNIDAKKSKIQTPTNGQENNNLDKKLDLSHRLIVGNTLKEVYRFYNVKAKQ
jgi:hypothetical protein